MERMGGIWEERLKHNLSVTDEGMELELNYSWEVELRLREDFEAVLKLLDLRNGGHRRGNGKQRAYETFAHELRHREMHFV